MSRAFDSVAPILLGMSVLGVVSGPDWAAPLFAAISGAVVVGQATAAPVPTEAAPSLATDVAPLATLLHDIAHSTDDDALRVEAALAQIRARANARGPRAWSSQEWGSEDSIS